MPSTLNLREVVLTIGFYIFYVIFVFQKITYLAIYIPTILLKLFISTKQRKEKNTIDDLEAFLLFLESISVYLGSGDSLEKSIFKYIEKISEKGEMPGDVSGKESEFERLAIYYSEALSSGKNVTDYFELMGRTMIDNKIISRFMKIIGITVKTSGDYKPIIDETVKNTRQQIFYFYDIHSSLAEKSFEIKVLMIMPYVLLVLMKSSLGDFFFSGYQSLMGMVTLSFIFFLVEVSSFIAGRNTRFDIK